MKILVTAGGTRERIDKVRFITNVSTGQTALLLASTLIARGHAVGYIHSITAPAPTGARTYDFESFDDLNKRLETILSSEPWDAVIHLAAVSDFSVSKITIGQGSFNPNLIDKIDSRESESIAIHLKPNFKILERLKSYSKNPHIKIIGFKLTASAPESEVRSTVSRMFESSGVDYVVQNDLSEIDESKHVARIFRKGDLLVETRTKQEMANVISSLLEETK